MLDRAEPGLRTPTTYLTPILPAHYDFIYSVVADPTVSWRWRYRGAVPSRDQVIAQFSTNALVQMLVVDSATEQMAGFVSLYDYNPRSATAYCAAAAHPRFHRSGRVSEATAVLALYGFHSWELRKIYFDVLEFNLDQMPMLTQLGREEGRLIGHERAFGRYWDLSTIAVYAEDVAAVKGTSMEWLSAIDLDATIGYARGLPADVRAVEPTPSVSGVPSSGVS